MMERRSNPTHKLPPLAIVANRRIMTRQQQQQQACQQYKLNNKLINYTHSNTHIHPTTRCPLATRPIHLVFFVRRGRTTHADVSQLVAPDTSTKIVTMSWLVYLAGGLTRRDLVV